MRCLRLGPAAVGRLADTAQGPRRWLTSLRPLAPAEPAAGEAATTEKKRTYWIESYGCAMNSSDSEVVASLLRTAGHSPSPSLDEAGLILVNTCAIRDNAEAKIWQRLAYFNSLKKSRRRSFPPLVGVLGCMAERLKDKLLDEDAVDLVCGPDAYRDLPRLVDTSSTGQKEANTRLSMEETYADIVPTRTAGSAGAFVSIMRGCNAMCSYCIVPFTRGRERSRPLASIIAEVQNLIDDKSSSSVKEVVLLGQNVNGYHDVSSESAAKYPESVGYKTSPGFESLYLSRKMEAPGARFVHLLSELSALSPELRIRFTSPHPKDFPNDVLDLIAQRPNICSSLHLPAQSGSNSVLKRMRRGYTRESYLALVQRARAVIPNVTISTDLITGFCGETESEHQETLDLMREVQYDQAFMFAYSNRETTHAARTMTDDVPEATKLRRLQEVIDVFRAGVVDKNRKVEWGAFRLVLVEGPATRSTREKPMLTGRTDGNKRVVFPHPKHLLPSASSQHLTSVKQMLRRHFDQNIRTSLDASLPLGTHMHASAALLHDDLSRLPPADVSSVEQSDTLVGRYVVVFIAEASGPTLRGVALAHSSLAESAKDYY